MVTVTALIPSFPLLCPVDEEFVPATAGYDLPWTYEDPSPLLRRLQTSRKGAVSAAILFNNPRPAQFRYTGQCRVRVKCCNHISLMVSNSIAVSFT